MSKFPKITVFEIKLLAILTMVADHVGLFLMDEYLPLRIVGRLSFPLFAWLIANGAVHTKNIDKYLTRLFILGVVSQLPYSLLIGDYIDTNYKINIFLTLYLGLYSIKLIKNKKLKYKYIYIAAIITGSYFFNFDYGLIGITSIILFYLFFDNYKSTFITQALNTVTGILLSLNNIFQLFSIFSLIVIGMYNGKEGPKVKWLFYSFYPAHLLLIYFIKLYI